MRFTVQKRRGVSPIVAALLMIVLVFVGFSMLYSISDSWMKAQKRNELFYMHERFIIEDIWFRNSSGTRTLVTIFIRNIGDVELNITRCRIDDISYTNTPGGLELSPDIAGNMNVTFSWSPETTYKIEFKTDRGNFVTLRETA